MGVRGMSKLPPFPNWLLKWVLGVALSLLSVLGTWAYTDMKADAEATTKAIPAIESRLSVVESQNAERKLANDTQVADLKARLDAIEKKQDRTLELLIEGKQVSASSFRVWRQAYEDWLAHTTKDKKK